ncbi:hypothetical protein GEV33_013543 [Tenebrio molitor]|uniref:Uncharacterized protein n=1 Tax=Tenebrio molitor TaxID=7067 RepID=A0A8J6H7E6_TENMO|nr:hypothetical protein GEV33_013543 [Tenebrio molitor]
MSLTTSSGMLPTHFDSASRERADVRGRGLGMEGTGGGGESAREIFEMGAKSGQKIARLHSEGRAKEKRLRVKAEKRVAKFEDKMGGSEECRKLNAREK